MFRFVPIFIAEFFFSLHFAATLYINSSFLEHFFPIKAIGFIYVLGAAISIIFFFIAPRLINRLGPRRFLLLFLIFTLGSTLGAAFAHNWMDALFFFLVYASVSLMVFYALDILVEEYTVNRKTGEVRGLYLTVMNAAIVLGPVLITLFTTDNRFSAFYLAAAAVLIPVFILVPALTSRRLKRRYPDHSLPLRLWWRKKSVRRATLARLVLEFFYTAMVVYSPIYLHDIIGFNWKEIGLIFVIMLLPFVLFEWPVGALADKKTGEKEIMKLGFGVMLVSLIFMPAIGQHFALWALALFISRIGASFIEITSESYFFKHVDASDTGLISIFRLSRAGGIILGALAGAAAIHFWPFYSIFFVMAFGAFLGMRLAARLVDTR